MNGILVIGNYDKTYSRNSVLFEAFRSQGFELVEYNKQDGFIHYYVRLLILAPKILRDALRSKLVFVPYPGWKILFYAKAISMLTHKKLLFDAYISLYETQVNDRKLANKGSLRACLYWLVDRISCGLADIVLLDTNEHINHITSKYSLGPEKFVRAFVGIRIAIHASIETCAGDRRKPLLFFYGGFSPLHGIQYILKSLWLLKNGGTDFVFLLIGDGQEGPSINRLINEFGLNDCIEKRPYMPYLELLSHMKHADICLGIFGESRKARMVIPNKVYDYAAMNKIIITGDSKAMHELFKEGTDYIGCPFADEAALANRIRYAIENLATLKRRMNPRKEILTHATPERIGQQLMADLRTRGI